MVKKKRVLNRIARIGLFTVILLFGTSVASVMGEAESLTSAGLSKASIRAVATTADNEVLYVGFTGGPQPTGIARSEDAGRTWQVVGPGPGLAINALAVHPHNEDWLYAGTGRNAADITGGLWVSDNGGQTWRKFPLGLPRGSDGLAPNVTALALDPNRPAILYVGAEGRGTYRFDLGRNSYSLIGHPASPGAYVKHIVVGPEGQAYVLTTEGLFVIAGDVLQAVTTLPDVAVSLAVDPVDPQTLYAGTGAYGVYRSVDGGQTWQAINAGLGWQPGLILRVPAVSLDETNPQHLAVATAYGVGSRLAGDGIYESFDAGQSWVKVAASEAVINALMIQDTGIYAVPARGFVRFGQPLPATSPGSWLSLRSLTRPTGTQMLIIIITLALAGFVLVGRPEWIPGHRQAKL